MKGLLVALALTITPSAFAQQNPITVEQSLQCTNPTLNEVDHRDTYRVCRDMILPYVCTIWSELPQGFGVPVYSQYMKIWNQKCVDAGYTQIQAPPPG